MEKKGIKKNEIKEKLKVEDDTEKKLQKYLKTKKGKKTKLYLVIGCVFLILGFILSIVKACLDINSVALGSFDLIFISGDWFYNFGCAAFILFFYIYFLDMFESKEINEEQKKEINKIDNVINLISRILLISLFEYSVTSMDGSKILTQLSSDILCTIIVLLGALFIIKLVYLIVINYDEKKKGK